MYMDSIRVTLFFYTIASLIEAFCIAFYKLRNACDIKLGQIFSKECIHNRRQLSISLEAFSSQLTFEQTKCPKVTGRKNWRVWWVWKNSHPKCISHCMPHLAVKCGRLKTLFSISAPSNYQVTGLLHMYCKRDEYYLTLIPLSYIKAAPPCTTLQ